MKSGKTLIQLATEVERQSKAKRDFIAPTGKMALALIGAAEAGLALGNGPMPVNNLAHGQIAEYVGINKPYYDKMRAEAPELLVRNVNHWFAKASEKKEKRLIRTLDGRVRALLSDSFRPLENVDLLEAVLPVIQEQKLVIVSSEITERRLYIKAFDQRVQREIEAQGTDPAHTFVRKDVLYPAITISTSEVGAGALSVAAGVWTGGCTNFASFSDSRMRKYHIGRKAVDSEDVYALLSDETKRLTDAAIWAQTRDVVASAFQIAKFESLVERIQDTTKQKIEGDVVKAMDEVSEVLTLSKAEGSSVLKRLIEGGDLSRYGVFNAVTRAAEDLEDYERASDLERAGGRIIELPASDWKRIANAA